MFNLCIHIISSRTAALEKSLISFYNYFNKYYNFPVYIYYFDDIYSKDFVIKLRESIDINFKQFLIDKNQNCKIFFKQVDYGLPTTNCEYKDLFFIKNNPQQPNRIGYLHMCSFWSNYYYYPGTEYNKYDLAFNFDDDSLWTANFPIENINTLIEQKDKKVLCFNCYKYPVNHRSKSVRVGLSTLIKYYCKKYNVEPKTDYLKNLLEFPLGSATTQEINFFQTNCVCYDTNITKLEIFETQEYKNWIYEVNLSRGIYKNRWGDNEIFSIFVDLHFEDAVIKLSDIKQAAGIVTEYIDPSALRNLNGTYAPGVKYNRQMANKQLQTLYN